MKLNGFQKAPVLAAALFGLTAASGSAQAQLSNLADGDLSANVAVVSDYRFRGVSQNFRWPALQGGLDFVSKNNWYVGTWASSVTGALYTNSYGMVGAGIEWDVYGGYKMDMGNGWVIDAGLLQYTYPGAGPNNTLEAYIGGSRDWFSVKYSHSISKKFFGLDDARGSGYIDLTATYPLAPNMNVVAHVGYQNINYKGAKDYTDFKLGVTYDWIGATWGAAVVGTTEDMEYALVGEDSAGRQRLNAKKLGGTGIVLSISKTF